MKVGTFILGCLASAVLLLLVLGISTGWGKVYKNQASALSTQSPSTQSPLTSPTDILPAISFAPSYEQIQKEVNRLVEEERARVGVNAQDWENFSQTPQVLQFQESLRGKTIVDWDGYATWIDKLRSPDTGTMLWIRMWQQGDEGTIRTNEPKVLLLDVSIEQLSKLAQWQNPDQLSQKPEHILFSGTISAVQPTGLISLTNVTIKIKE